jgi:hypothetical protein
MDYPDDAMPPDPPNCRCVVVHLPENWLEDLEETLDERIGDTMPLINVWVLPGLILEYM